MQVFKEKPAEKAMSRGSYKGLRPSVSFWMTAALVLLVASCPDSPKNNTTENPPPEEEIVTGFHSWTLTPPMGWNSYDCYGISVNEAQTRANAEYMADNLKQYGWEYIVVDHRWFATTPSQSNGSANYGSAGLIIDEWGRHTPAVNRFPSAANGAGFKPLADYIHDLGLKFGIHIMRGIPVPAVNQRTPIKGTDGITANQVHTTEDQCRWFWDNYTVDVTKPGAQEYYDSIFELYAEWGVDFVKVDDLLDEVQNPKKYRDGEIEMVRKAIDRAFEKTGWPIVFSMSPGATPVERAEHVINNSNMWRIVNDLWDVWGDVYNEFEVSKRWIPYIGSGHWPDADMLPLGRLNINGPNASGGTGPRQTRLTPDEQYTLMSLFTMMRSPLMFGGNMPDLENDAFTTSLLTNAEVLYMHKKSKNNRELYNEDGVIVWTADDSGSSDKFLALFFAASGYDEGKALFTQKVTRETPGRGVNIDVPLTGKTDLYLVVAAGEDSNSYDWADWVNPKLYKADGSETLLTDLEWVSATSGWNQPRKNLNVDGGALKINGVSYTNGIGTHAESVIRYTLPTNTYVRFTAFAGLDNGGTDQDRTDPNYGSNVVFMVFDTSDFRGGDNRKVSFDMSKLGLTGKVKVRDMWKKQDLGVFSGNEFAPEINFHGAGMYRLSR